MVTAILIMNIPTRSPNKNATHNNFSSNRKSTQAFKSHHFDRTILGVPIGRRSGVVVTKECHKMLSKIEVFVAIAE